MKSLIKKISKILLRDDNYNIYKVCSNASGEVSSYCVMEYLYQDKNNI